ncbi:hypothetical protein WOLCODRAFT_20030 [Wolfiporia cocos MD-104 SS10]|uniref:Uncharacterized protein n=1 Tax=Wolfiporia cocos (strain MD-104) TaxID=742152 RepID=A0A2H3JHQ6_WOLCO|nr:hypothetical protein WOLCODRAFT_20030 [Wolfiporia cocos MD-104 SS10]
MHSQEQGKQTTFVQLSFSLANATFMDERATGQIADNGAEGRSAHQPLWPEGFLGRITRNILPFPRRDLDVAHRHHAKTMSELDGSGAQSARARQRAVHFIHVKAGHLHAENKDRCHSRSARWYSRAPLSTSGAF